MINIVKESALIACVTMAVLLFLQPFGIDQMTNGRILLITGDSLLVFLSSVLSYFILQLLKMENHDKKFFPCFHVINIPLVSGAILSLNSLFYWDKEVVKWYCTQGEFSIINYLTVCAEVVLVSVFILLYQMLRMRNLQMRKELDEIRQINQLLSERQMPEVQQLSESKTTCILQGNANNAVFEVNPNNILYIESMSNYADICYLDNDELFHKTLRITMKQLTEALASFPSLVQCHRAFIVNLDFVISIAGRLSTGFTLQLFKESKQIVVSRTFTKEIQAKLEC